MYRKITQEKLLKRYKCFQVPMDIMYPLLWRSFSPKYYLVSPSNGWLADVYIFNDIAITTMYFIQKLQGGNSNETY